MSLTLIFGCHKFAKIIKTFYQKSNQLSVLFSPTHAIFGIILSIPNEVILCSYLKYSKQQKVLKNMHRLRNIRNYSKLIDIKPEVRLALKKNNPVVALESTIITHGMPYPQNIETALEVENIVRSQVKHSNFYFE